MPRTRPLALSAIALGILASQSTSASMLEEIIVTATKRAESMQDVPISMLAKSGESIKEFALTTGADFTADIPAVTIGQNAIGNFIFIRGIGTQPNQGIEQSVSIYHDGVYMGRHQLSRAPFMDLDRVEVLRGPQSILFGKNTIGGAIHVITAKPTDELEGVASLLYGTDGEQELTGVVSGPITERVSGRLAYRKYALDGYLDNVMTGTEGPDRDDETLRGQLRFDATDSLTVTAKWEHSEFNQEQWSTQVTRVSPFTPAAAQVSALNAALVAAATGGNGVERYDSERAVINDGGALLGQIIPAFSGIPGFPDKPEMAENEYDLGTLTFEWQIGELALTAISGYATYDYRDICDCDFSALPLIQVDGAEDYEQFSQEIRLTSPGGETFDYIVGAYYQQSDLDYRSVEGFGTHLLAPPELPSTLFPNLTRDYSMDQDAETLAAFGSVTWNFLDSTRLTLGLRYSKEEKKVDHALEAYFTGGWDYSALAALPAGTLAFGDTPEEYDRFLTTPGLEAAAGVANLNLLNGALGTFEHDIRGRERSEEFVTWNIGLEHDLNEDAMAFLTVSTGRKGGGFDARFLRANDDDEFFEFDEEKAINYEVGIKSTLLDGAMTMNAVAFYSTVEDFQVSIFDGATAFFVQNAAEIESKGVEFDLAWAATERLTVNFAATFLDNEYSDFANAPCWAGTIANNRGDCVGRDTPEASRDASGDRNMFAPEFAYNLRFDYIQPIGQSLEGRATLNVNYSDEYFAESDLDPVYVNQDAYTKVDLRLSLASIEGNWELALIGKNLTEELTSTNSNDQPLVPGNGFAFTDRLRSYAAQVTYRF